MRKKIGRLFCAQTNSKLCSVCVCVWGGIAESV
jgi:hypothetical protein